MEHQLITGIFSVYDADATENKKRFIGFSYNVKGTIKRLRFELALNAASYKPLQAFYNECRSPVIELYEVLNATPELDYADPNNVEAYMHIQAKLLSASADLSSKGESVTLIQCPI